MGEYATRRSDNEHIKIGTCENMFQSIFRWSALALRVIIPSLPAR